MIFGGRELDSKMREVVENNLGATVRADIRARAARMEAMVLENKIVKIPCEAGVNSTSDSFYVQTFPGRNTDHAL